MSDEEESYCRLCAEVTNKEQLISPDEDVSVSSKIQTKMCWINVDLSVNSLPNSICFACFDSLERTWKFLHNVRAAQQKLVSIFSPKPEAEACTDSVHENVGKPVNEDWETFENRETYKDSKLQIKKESETEFVLDIIPVENVKNEPDSDVDNSYKFHDNDISTTDSDAPLVKVFVKKNKLKKKKRTKIKYDNEILESCLKNEDAEAIPLDMSLSNLTWAEYGCYCATCNASCKNITALQLHSLQEHSSCAVFKCTDCDKKISTFHAFVKHVRLHNKALRYCCEYCNELFSLTTYLQKHLNSKHNVQNLCINCGALFESSESLDEHILTYGKGSRVKRIRETLLNDKFHLKCEHCNKEFKSRSNLHQHRLVHSQRSRDFFCHICGKMFFTKGTLSTHMKTHEETKPYKCEFCPLTFRARGNLHSHISLHSGSKPFICEQCGKSFRVKRHLKSHSIVHTDLMPYVCEFCNKSFRFKTRLNLHLRQHTGAKPYKCAFCQRDFTNGSNFKKHMRRRHNVDTSIRKYNNIVVENDDANRVPIS